jgi:hypothetical protein
VEATFPCSADNQCKGHEGDGRCEPSGFCSFPDALCTPTGYRYSSYAGEGLATRCTNDPASAYWGAVLADHPVGYWRLGEAAGIIAVDAVGNHPGTYTGGFTLGFAGALGNANTAVGLDGATGYVTIPDLGLAMGSFSVEGWVLVDGAGSVHDTTNVALLGNAISPPHTLLVNTDPAAVPGRVAALFGTSTLFNSTTTITFGAWHHLVYTYDAASHVQSLYIDGAPAGTDVVASPPYPDFPAGFYLGTQATYQYWLRGGIDEVAVYDHALGLAEVQAHELAATMPGT